MFPEAAVVTVTTDDLNELQRKKLRLAANILRASAEFYDGSQSTLPLWGGGVITHGIPKITKCVIGITKDAKVAAKKDTTNDHLYRVTETARYVLNRIRSEKLSVEEIESILLQRSALMTTTRTENNSKLKEAVKHCSDKDSWEELYMRAGIEYELYRDRGRGT